MFCLNHMSVQGKLLSFFLHVKVMGYQHIKLLLVVLHAKI